MRMKSAAQVMPAELTSRPRTLFRSALIVGTYLFAFIILDLFTPTFEELPGVVAWYPPSGLSFALLLVFGIRFVPAVMTASLISSVFIYRFHQLPEMLFLWAFIMSLIYGAAALFMRSFLRFDWRLRELRDVVCLIFMAVIVSALLASLSVAGSAMSGVVPRGEIFRAIVHWWIGETVGVLTVTPFLLIYVMPGLKLFTEGNLIRQIPLASVPRPMLTGIAQASGLVLTLYWVFGVRVMDGFQPLYLIILPLIWMALQSGFKRVTAGIVALNFGVPLSVWFFQFDLVELGELQLLMIVNCIVGLLMGAVVSGRKRAENTLRGNEEKHKEMLANISDVLAIMDIDGIIRYKSSNSEKYSDERFPRSGSSRTI